MIYFLVFLIIVMMGTFLRPALSWLNFERHIKRVMRVLESFGDEVVTLYTVVLKEKVYEVFQRGLIRKESIDSIFKELAVFIADLFGCDGWSVLITPKDKEWSFIAWSKNLDKVNLRAIAKTLKEMSNTNINEVIDSGEVRYINNTRKRADWRNFKTPVMSWVGLPLKVGGEVIGVINLDWFEPGRVKPYTIDSLRNVVPDIERVLDSMEEFRRLVFESDLDVMLDIPNIQAFKRYSRYVESEGRRVGLIAIDLDKFKRVNEIYGHTVGNELLKMAKERIMSNIRSEDKLFRYGGDEFVLVVEKPAREKLEVIERKLRHVFLKVFEVNREGVPVFIKLGIRVGTAIYPDDAPTVEEALKKAFERMI